MKFSIPADHPSLPGHFPGRPIVPGVLLLERVMEAIERTHGPVGSLRLPQVKFVQPLLPGELAEVELEEVELAGSAASESTPGRWRFRVLRAGVVLASGEVVAAEVDGQMA